MNIIHGFVSKNRNIGNIMDYIIHDIPMYPKLPNFLGKLTILINYGQYLLYLD